MSGIVGITCDGPGCTTRAMDWAVGAPSVGAVRTKAKPYGWHAVRIPPSSGRRFGTTRDICPECWAKGVR